MPRLLTLCLTGLLMVVALPGLADQKSPPGTSKDERGSIKKTVHVEIKGTLEEVVRVKDIYMPYDTWYITVNGQTYWLHFGDNKDLEARTVDLKGKTVIVKGTLETQVHTKPPEAKTTRPAWTLKEVVLVTDLKAEELAEFQGKLEHD